MLQIYQGSTTKLAHILSSLSLLSSQMNVVKRNFSLSTYVEGCHNVASWPTISTSSWRWWSHIQGGRLLLSLLQSGLMCLPFFFAKCIFYIYAGHIVPWSEKNFLARKGWLAIAKLKPLSLFISLLLMLKKAFDNVKIEKWKVKMVLA